MGKKKSSLDQPVHLIGRSTVELLDWRYTRHYRQRVRSLTLLGVGVSAVANSVIAGIGLSLNYTLQSNPDKSSTKWFHVLKGGQNDEKIQYLRPGGQILHDS